jgi:serine protease Do
MRGRWTILVGVLAICLLAPAPVSQAQRGGRGSDSNARRNDQEWRESFRPVIAETRQAVVMVRCDDRQTIGGMIVSADGWVVTKESELWGEKLTVRLCDDREFPAVLHAANHEHDLALLKLELGGQTLTPVAWGDAGHLKLGELLATAGVYETPLAAGVLSVARRAIPTRGGMLGVQLDEDPRGPKVVKVVADSEAAKAGIQPQDIIVALAGVPTPTRDDLLEVLNRRPIGATFTLKLLRDGREIEVSASLGKRPATQPSRSDLMNQMGGALSLHASGFPEVFQHDGVLRPIDCGTPVVDLDGKVVGMNIARAGRTETYAIPEDVVRRLVEELKKER